MMNEKKLNKRKIVKELKHLSEFLELKEFIKGQISNNQNGNFDSNNTRDDIPLLKKILAKLITAGFSKEDIVMAVAEEYGNEYAKEVYKVFQKVK